MNLKQYLANVFIFAEFELRKLRHDSTQIWLRTIQPALWLLVFGEVFTRTRIIPTGDYTYLQFMTPGVLTQSVMFAAIFFGIQLIWERDLGLLNKLLSTPAPRSAIVLGKAFSAGVRGIFQALAVLVLALIVRVHLTLGPLNVLGVLVLVILCGMCFSAFSMCLTSVFRTRDRMMGIGQALTMPLFFASNAIYPISVMPGWLQAIATVNPLSYIVEAMRSLLLTGDYSRLGIDLLAITAVTVLLITVASLRFRRIMA
jgi:ABC-2 type transport system permease protein